MLSYVICFRRFRYAEAVVPDLPKTAYSVQPCIDDVRPLAQRGASDDPAISDATFIQGFMRHVDVVTSTRHVIDNTRKSRERRIPGRTLVEQPRYHPARVLTVYLRVDDDPSYSSSLSQVYSSTTKLSSAGISYASTRVALWIALKRTRAYRAIRGATIARFLVT